MKLKLTKGLFSLFLLSFIIAKALSNPNFLGLKEMYSDHLKTNSQDEEIQFYENEKIIEKSSENSTNQNLKKTKAISANSCDPVSDYFLIYWNSQNYESTIYNPVVTALPSVAGAGLQRSLNTGHNYQILTGINALTESEAITNNEYIEYTITANKYIGISKIGYYSLVSSQTGEDTQYNFSLRVSSDNFATNQIVHGTKNYVANQQEIEFSVNNGILYLKPNIAYKFRVYFYGINGGSTATIGHDDFKLYGYVECDNDGDGIPDICDLDDDNDGILDVNENSCNNSEVVPNVRIGYIPNSRNLSTDNGYTFDGIHMNNSATLKLLSTSNFGPTGTVKANVTLVPITANPITKSSIAALNLNAIFIGGFDNPATGTSYLADNELTAIKDWSDDSTSNFVVVTQTHTKAWGSTITSGNINPNTPTAFGKSTSIFNGPFGLVTSFNQGASYQTYFATLNNFCSTKSIAVDGNNRTVMYIDGVYNDLIISDVDILTTYGGVTSGNAITSNSDKLFANIWAFVISQSTCTDLDTDGDGIPNRLDLDSDGDGCPDAIEGGASFTTADLQVASGSLSTQTINLNLGTNVDENGIPVFATPIFGYANGSGQSLGGANNILYNDCKAFVCDEVMYLTQGNDTLLYTTNTSDLQNLSFVQNGTSNNIRYNATGFNPLNGKLYAVLNNTNQVIMINNDGTYVNLGAVMVYPMT